MHDTKVVLASTYVSPPSSSKSSKVREVSHRPGGCNLAVALTLANSPAASQTEYHTRAIGLYLRVRLLIFIDYTWFRFCEKSVQYVLSFDDSVSCWLYCHLVSVRWYFEKRLICEGWWTRCAYGWCLWKVSQRTGDRWGMLCTCKHYL